MKREIILKVIALFFAALFSLNGTAVCGQAGRMNLAVKTDAGTVALLRRHFYGDVAELENFVRRLSDWGVPVEKIMYDNKRNFLFNTADLMPQVPGDKKKSWVMSAPRAMNRTSPILPFEVLARHAVKLTSPLLLKVGSVTRNEHEPDNPARFITGSRWVYLGFIDKVKHPVMIKVFDDLYSNPDDSVHFDWAEHELAQAQLFSLWGKGPRFYGVGRTEKGRLFYAMQAVEGHFLSKRKDKAYNQYGLDTDQFLLSSAAHEIPIDFGNIIFFPGFKSEQLKKTHELLSRLRQEEKRGAGRRDFRGAVWRRLANFFGHEITETQNDSAQLNFSFFQSA